jgi:hypothetical protein
MQATDAARFVSAKPNSADLVIEPQPAEYANLHSFDITPELKQQVQTQGLPQYKKGGVVHMAGGGTIAKMAEEIAAKLGQKILPAADIEANKVKFLEPSQVKDVLYRGQRKVPKADKFIMTQGRENPSFTTDPEVANVYSRKLDTLQHGSGSTSVPVHLQMTKPLDIRNLGDHVQLDEFVDMLKHDLSKPYGDKSMGYHDLANMLDELDETAYKTNANHEISATDSSGLGRIRDFEQLGNEIRHAGKSGDVDRILNDLLPNASIDAYSLGDSLPITRELKKQGYDGLIHKDVFDAGMPYYQGNPNNIEEGQTASHIIDTYRPFYQGQIKSAIGNQGTYDVTNPDITKKHGGTISKDAMWMEVQDKKFKGK